MADVVGNKCAGQESHEGAFRPVGERRTRESDSLRLGAPPFARWLGSCVLLDVKVVGPSQWRYLWPAVIAGWAPLGDLSATERWSL